jgi:diacylglycerol kinase family enzyme
MDPLSLALSLLSLSLLAYFYFRDRSTPFNAKEFLRQHHKPQSYLQKGKKVVVLLNPVAGAGAANSIFQKYLSPLLKELEVDVDLVTTSGPYFARDYVRNLVKEGKLGYDGLIVISGDGLIHQVIQGIGLACDHDTLKMKDVFRRCPLIPIPAGSSNGVTSSFGYLTLLEVLGGVLRCKAPRLVRLLQGTIYEQPKADEKKKEELGVSEIVWSVLQLSWGCGAEYDYYQERKFRGIHPLIKNVLAPILSIGQKVIFSSRIAISSATDPSSFSPSFPSPFLSSFSPLIPISEKEKEKRVPWEGYVPITEGLRETENEAIVIGALNLPRAGSDILTAPFSMSLFLF